MRSFKIFNRRATAVVAAFALFFSFVAPTIAAAASVTTRSIALSSSTASATGVSYQLKFTSVGAAGGIVLDFCDDSPLVGQTCNAPAGFSLSTATTATAGWTRTVVDANTIKLTGTIGAASAVTVDIDNVTNPTSASNPFYGRIVTYATSGDLANYTSATSLGAGTVDDGGVAMAITNKIGVSAAVLESMTFCVAGGTTAIGANCDISGNTAPTLKLGEDTGGVIALDATHLSTGDIYTQISTNAVGGAIVNLKSNTLGCGGLVRAGAASNAAGCGIAPALLADFSASAAKFGVRTGTAAGVGSSNGTYQPFNTGNSPIYSNTAYAMNYISGDATGVTSTYGDPFLETTGPANNMGMKLTFGASIANNTPAGLYSADLSLVATGKF